MPWERRLSEALWPVPIGRAKAAALAEAAELELRRPRKHSGLGTVLTKGLFRPGHLGFPQAGWPRREPATPAPAAKSSPDNMAAGQPPVLFGSEERLSRQEAFNLHSGNHELRGTSFPFQGAQWNCTTGPFARRAPFHPSMPSVLLPTCLGNRGSTCQRLPPVYALPSWGGGRAWAGGGQLDGTQSSGVGAFQKVSLLFAAGLRHCHRPVGKLSTIGIAEGWGGSGVSHILCLGLNGCQQGALPHAPAPSSFSQRAEAILHLADTE